MIKVQENIQPMMRAQRTLFKCPLCDATNVVFVSPESLCSYCRQNIPNIFRLIKDNEYRVNHYLGKLRLLRVVK